MEVIAFLPSKEPPVQIIKLKTRLSLKSYGRDTERTAKRNKKKERKTDRQVYRKKERKNFSVTLC